MSTSRQFARRGLASAAASAMILALLPGVASAAHLADVCSFADDASFPDVSEDDLNVVQIECIAGFDIVQGDDDGNFDATAGVTRGQAAIFVATFLEVATGDVLPEVDPNPFDDVTDGAAASSILKLVDAGIVQGTTSDTYSPQDTLTRGQMAAILANALEFLGVPLDSTDNGVFSDIGEPFGDDINALNNFDPPVAAGFDDGTFRPGNTVTRGQLARFVSEIVYQADEAGLFTPSDEVGDANTGIVTADAAGTITFQPDDGSAAVTATYDTAATEGDTLFVDGTAATATAFEAAADLGDILSVEDTDGDGDFDVFMLTNNTVTSGIVGQVDITDDADLFAIVTVRNVEISPAAIGDTTDTDVSFSVDGTVVTRAAFEANIQHGDTIVATDTTATPDGDYETFALTNATVTGPASNVDTTANTFNIGSLGDDYATGQDTLFDYTGGDIFTVDGSAGTLAAFEAAFTNGDTISYMRTNDVETYALTNGTVDNSFTGTTVDAVDAGQGDGTNDGSPAVAIANADGVVFNEARAVTALSDDLETITYADEDGNDQVFDLSTAASYAIDGTLSSLQEFINAVQNGLTVGETLAFNDSNDRLSLTTALTAGPLTVPTATVSATDADGLANDSFDVRLGTVTVIAGLPANATFDNASGAATNARYFVNGAEVSADVYEDYLVDIDDSTNAAEAEGDTFTVTVTTLATEHRLTTNNTL